MVDPRVCQGLVDRFSAFLRDHSGGFAIQLGLMLIPLALLAGGSMDYVRLQNAKASAQTAADAAALAAAVVILDPAVYIEDVARNAVLVNLRNTLASEGKLTHLEVDPIENSVSVQVEGDIPTTFLTLANIQTLNYTATSSALRRLDGAAEVALVLDNTWSMNGSRITALRAAASSLVDTLTRDPRANVRVAVVPYADYVNVGLGYRNAGWMDVPPDYAIESPGSCTTITSASVCNYGNPQTCYHMVDGMSEGYTCYPDLQCYQVPLNPPLSHCNPPSSRPMTWWGCVKSRLQGLHVTDARPDVRYEGILNSLQTCPTPILPLTHSISTIKSAIQSMAASVGGYRPETYIPSGLIWGWNVLSPQAPFTEGRAYHETNENPRKAMVLMTDGANTMFLHPNGGHYSTTNPAQIATTYTDMQILCNNIRSQNIEIFAVAFEVVEPVSLNAMRNCASGPNYYFDATDAAALNAAFNRIAQELATVRLIR